MARTRLAILFCAAAGLVGAATAAEPFRLAHAKTADVAICVADGAGASAKFAAD